MSMHQYDIEGCIKLACEIARQRSEAYKFAFKMHIINPCNFPYNEVIKYEKYLKGPLTSLTDRDIKSLQMEMEADKAVACKKRRVMVRYYISEHKTPREIEKETGIHQKIIERWINDYKRIGAKSIPAI